MHRVEKGIGRLQEVRNTDNDAGNHIVRENRSTTTPRPIQWKISPLDYTLNVSKSGDVDGSGLFGGALGLLGRGNACSFLRLVSLAPVLVDKPRLKEDRKSVV